ncbi:MAG: hypothetical protein IPL27_10725 [Lewinellaceae bacterium]|jgi:hypothetical protein|nr:hypothetical protein [Lewinellaceae bacterium]MBP6812665.1 hypothetical protein [Saprospiraceae bacterium]
MDSISFKGLPSDTHHCTSHRDGDWVIWRCPHCTDYERRMNWQTGEMRTLHGRSTARHTGISTQKQNMEALKTIRSFN